MTRFFGDLKKYAYFIWYSAKTDLKAEVANSYLNWVWWILEPLFNMLVYYYVFGNMMGSTQEHYIVFIYSAQLMWTFFNKTLNYSTKCVRSNRDIVTKVYMPKFVLLLSNMVLNGIKLLISVLILIVLMITNKVAVNGMLVWVVVVYLVMMLFTFGCSMIFLHFGVFVDDLSYAISILTSMLFFLSGIFYDVSVALPQPMGTILATYNPMAFFINSMRNALLYKTCPDLPVLSIWAIVSVVLCVIGVKTIYRYENSYVKVV